MSYRKRQSSKFEQNSRCRNGLQRWKQFKLNSLSATLLSAGELFNGHHLGRLVGGPPNPDPNKRGSLLLLRVGSEPAVGGDRNLHGGHADLPAGLKLARSVGVRLEAFCGKRQSAVVAQR